MTSFTRKQFERRHVRRHSPRPPDILRKGHKHEDKRRKLDEQLNEDEWADDGGSCYPDDDELEALAYEAFYEDAWFWNGNKLNLDGEDYYEGYSDYVE